MNTNYNNYTINDFLIDDDFIEWVLSPDSKLDLVWNQWISEHPEKENLITDARNIILNINKVENQFIPADQSDDSWEFIKKATIDKTPTKVQATRNNWFAYAAAIALLVLGSTFIVLNFQKKDVLVDHEKPSWLIEENTTAIAQDIQLPDGSLVILEPYSSLKYPSFFVEKQREVILKGEAFFNIERDTAHPFLIYANETITKVLGTSFTIKAYEGDKDVEVIVKTGKVAVYANVTSKNKEASNKKIIINADKKVLIPLPNRKLEVTPNQKIIFNKTKKELIKTIAAIPIVIETPLIKRPKLKYNDAPITEIFDALSSMYGLEINYDKTQLKDCHLTTNLADLPMMEKIRIICDALSLNFKENDGVIFINGGDCS